MTNPILSFANALDRRRQKRAVADAQANAHIARDIGLPYRPQPVRRTDLW